MVLYVPWKTHPWLANYDFVLSSWHLFRKHSTTPERSIWGTPFKLYFSPHIRSILSNSHTSIHLSFAWQSILFLWVMNYQVFALKVKAKLSVIYTQKYKEKWLSFIPVLSAAFFLPLTLDRLVPCSFECLYSQGNSRL